MTEVIHSSSASPSSSPSLYQARDLVDEEEAKGGNKEKDQLSLLALLVALFRKSFWLACKAERAEHCCSAAGMEIGWPTNVRHIAHVTFDRFNGFLGLPVEFEPEVPRRSPSASAIVFGVSTESMQLSFDSRGNSVPTILLLMQRHLYAKGGFQREGIFRINPEERQEEYAREQLNRGVVPDGICVHCLAGLIKAWFRELPSGVLDSLPQEHVIQCQTEEECSALVRLLPSTEASLLDWAINLMADVVQEEFHNKMNARNIAMVFAPNMTQVMNFLRTPIEKKLRERKDSLAKTAPTSSIEPSGENGPQNHPLQPIREEETGGDLTDEEYLSYSDSSDESEDSSSSCESCLHTTRWLFKESDLSNPSSGLVTEKRCKRTSNLITERV